MKNRVFTIYAVVSVLERHSAITGDNSERETPVHIPNTEVKTFSANNTCLAVSREDRTLPVFQLKNPGNSGFFLFSFRENLGLT